MIRVRIEMLPKGDAAKAREIADIRIVNVTARAAAGADDAICEYEVEAFERAWGDQPDIRFFGGFAHRRGQGILSGLAAALRSIGK